MAAAFFSFDNATSLSFALIIIVWEKAL